MSTSHIITPADEALRAIRRGMAQLQLAEAAFEEADLLLAALPVEPTAASERCAIVKRNAAYVVASASGFREVLEQVVRDYTDALRGCATNADLFRDEVAAAGYTVMDIGGVEHVRFGGALPAVCLDDPQGLVELARVTRAEIAWLPSGDKIIVYPDPETR